MPNETSRRESELHADDYFSVDRLRVRCHTCSEEFFERSAKTSTKDGRHTAYTMKCKSAGCSARAFLKVPRSKDAPTGVPIELRVEETELHPDDNFSIGGLDVLLAFDGPSLLRKLKEVDADFEQTLYRYQPPGEAIPEIKVFVPHK